MAYIEVVCPFSIYVPGFHRKLFLPEVKWMVHINVMPWFNNLIPKTLDLACTFYRHYGTLTKQMFKKTQNINDTNFEYKTSLLRFLHFDLTKKTFRKHKSITT